MSKLKRMLLGCLLIFSVISIGGATAFARPPIICNLQGVWLGYDSNGNANLMSTVNGQSFSNGTYIVHIPGFNWASLGFAGIGATGYGTWKRTGFNTFAVTFIALPVNSTNGETLAIAKVDATDTLSDNCNSMEIEATISLFYDPKANPFVDEPDLGPFLLPPHGDVIRMAVTPLE